MPVYLLKIKADLENIAELTPLFENLWKFNITNGSGEERLGITVSKGDVLELNGSKGDANYVMKWHKSDAHQAYIKLVDVKKVDGTYKKADSGTWVTILGLECRGLVPTAWIPGETEEQNIPYNIIRSDIFLWRTLDKLTPRFDNFCKLRVRGNSVSLTSEQFSNRYLHLLSLSFPISEYRRNKKRI